MCLLIVQIRFSYLSYALTIAWTSRCLTTSFSEKKTKSMPSMPSSIFMISMRPEGFPCGRSIWVTSPVMTAFELNPIRVRNIFICSTVVFWASSRMMKESLRVLPRMKARGAISMTPAFDELCRLFRLHHIKERVVEWSEVGVYLFKEVSGEKSELLSGLDCGPCQDDPANLLFQKGIDRHRHRKIGLACSGRAHADDNIVVLDALQIPPLGLCLGDDEAPLRRYRDMVFKEVFERGPAAFGYGPDGIADVFGPEVIARCREGLQVMYEAFGSTDLLVVALEEYLVAAEARRNAEALFDQHEVLLQAVEDQRKLLPLVKLYLYGDRNSSLFVH